MAARTAPVAGDLEGAFDEAVDRITDLTLRLWAIRAAHRAVVVKPLLRPARLTCTGCGRPAPCPTLRAADDPRPHGQAPR